MEKIVAEFNHGRWIAICPRCRELGIISALEVKPDGKPFICPEEFPGTQARMFVDHPTHKGAYLSVRDEEARQNARSAAVAAGQCYEIAFPGEKSNIERTLRFRPRYAQNWFPGVRVEELAQENDRMAAEAAAAAQLEAENLTEIGGEDA